MTTKENSEKENVRKESLPKGWVELVKETMKSSITKEDFKQFLKQEKEKKGLKG